MIEQKDLIAIYTQRPFSNAEEGKLTNFYFILYVFNDNGLVDRDVLQETYKEDQAPVIMFKQEDFLIGPFSQFEDIQAFAIKLAEELDAPRIILNSIESYNLSIEKSLNTKNFIGELLDSGREILNIDYKESRGILKRLFN